MIFNPGTDGYKENSLQKSVTGIFSIETANQGERHVRKTGCRKHPFCRGHVDVGIFALPPFFFLVPTWSRWN